MTEPERYKTIFDAVESTLIRQGHQNRINDIVSRLDAFKSSAPREFSDADASSFDPGLWSARNNSL